MTVRRTVAILLPVAAAATLLAGCGGLGARLTFDDTAKVKVTEIRMSGSSGSVMIKTAPIAETHITRTIHRGTDPGESYRVDGTVLLIDTDCGSNCTVSYDIEAPTGVKVTGELTSGDVDLTGIGAADVKVTSGNIMVKGATGEVKVQATSGDIDVVGSKAAVTVDARSGNIRALDSTGPVTLTATSGNIEVELTSAASVRAEATSGNVDVIVPPGDYRLTTETSSGEAAISGVNDNPAAKNVLDLHASSGDVSVNARGPQPSPSIGG